MAVFLIRFIRNIKMRLKQPSILPGFGLTMGITLLYLSILVLLPLSGLLIRSATIPWHDFLATIVNPRVVAAYRLSFLTALAAAVINAIFGLLVAWVLVRYHFPLKKIVDALVDLPFALPTAVAGISLTSIYATSGLLGKVFDLWGVKIAFTPLGIIVALSFVSLPFVVRTIQPVLEDLEPDWEEAAVSLGATRWQTFTKVIFPHLRPSLLTGFVLAFARSLGEYGSIVFISGNMPFRTEIVPLLIMTKLEQYDYVGANVIAAVMLFFSFLFLFLINFLQWHEVRGNRA